MIDNKPCGCRVWMEANEIERGCWDDEPDIDYCPLHTPPAPGSWSSTPPTEEGWWWTRLSMETSPHVASVLILDIAGDPKLVSIRSLFGSFDKWPDGWLWHSTPAQVPPGPGEEG